MDKFRRPRLIIIIIVGSSYPPSRCQSTLEVYRGSHSYESWFELFTTEECCPCTTRNHLNHDHNEYLQKLEEVEYMFMLIRITTFFRGRGNWFIKLFIFSVQFTILVLNHSVLRSHSAQNIMSTHPIFPTSLSGFRDLCRPQLHLDKIHSTANPTKAPG